MTSAPLPAAGATSLRTTVAGAPEGLDARVLAGMAATTERPILHVGRDRRRMARLRLALAFFAPELEVLAVPEWDCLPYDRLSPSPRVVADRMEDLSRLAVEGRDQPPRLVLTTVAALLQRLPPRRALAAARFRAVVGDAVDPAGLRDALIAAGYYIAAGAVDEIGEFDLKPDTLDLFPPDEERPLRLSFAGGRLARVHAFDPDSGEAAGEPRREVLVRPCSEVFLDADSIARFGRAYAEAFGAAAEQDTLAQTVAAGRRRAGMEHWLPLFHDSTETLLDYVEAASVVLDVDCGEHRDARLEQIADAYTGRRSMLPLQADGQAYRPLPPERLFLDTAGWDGMLAGRDVVLLSPNEPGDGAEDAGGRPLTGAEEPAALLARLSGKGRRIIVAAPAGLRRMARRLQAPIARRWTEMPEAGIAVAPLDVPEPFAAPGLAVLPARLLEPGARPRQRRQFAALSGVGELAIGERVIHQEHGLGLCDGLEVIEAGGKPRDTVRLLYRGDAKLYVPAEAVDLLWRYGEEGGPQLDKLGGDAWTSRRDAAAQAIMPAVRRLVRQAAARERRRVAPLRPDAAFRRFVARFPYQETEGQAAAIDDVLADLAGGRPMDRLVCGDVGFGKTEVALRAAFVVARAGRQVAVIVPTTPLCRQHYDQFRSRFSGFGIPVAQLSRSVSAADSAEIKQRLADGAVRVVIGTQALLSADVSFHDLGLLVVDEEQRLGVKQKERLRRLARDVHVLTMTATPIPRTLQLALCGLRQLSLIDTAPVARKPVRSLAVPDEPDMLRQALLRERRRGGQSFYVCPRLSDLHRLRRILAELVPDLDIAIAHGKLAPAELDRAMTAFADGRHDVLLSTNIIETGLDIPNANTLIVHRADMFGMAQLHQLRGRVGRSARRGWAYLTFPPGQELTEEARRRLEVLTTITDPGAGYALAQRDMDIRGSGDLLGEEQSGHIHAVGSAFFQRLLRAAVEAVRRGEEAPPAVWSPRLQLDVALAIPRSYLADPAQRLAVYREAATLEEPQDADDLAEDLAMRFGPPPPEIENLLAVGEIKRLCRAKAVEQLDAGPRGAVLQMRDGRRLRHQAAWPGDEAKLAGLRRLLEGLR